MAEQWLELGDSGLQYDWSPMEVAGSLSLIGSTITATAAEQAGSFNNLFELFVPDALAIRLTFQSFETDTITNGVLYEPAKFRDFDGVDLQGNEASPFPSSTWDLPTGPLSEWLPNPVEFTETEEVAYLQTRVTGDGIPVPETFALLVEVLVEVPDPPPPGLGDVYVIRGNLRAYRGTDNPMTVFVRNEEGPIDLSGVQSLQAVVMGRAGGPGGWGGPSPDYGFGFPDWRPIITVDATSTSPGRVTFTLTSGNLRTRLWGSLYTLFVRADNRTIYSALLEIV